MLILIATRDPAISRILCRLCGQESWRTVTVAGSQALVDCALRLRPDFIIADASLDGPPDAASAALAIRADWPSAPIVLMTGSPERATLLRDQGLCVLEKPFTWTEARALLAGK